VEGDELTGICLHGQQTESTPLDQLIVTGTYVYKYLPYRYVKVEGDELTGICLPG
jgi:hypothetical protein